MKIAVIGLGLIGGSIAKVLKQNKQNTVYGLDIDKSVVLKAKLFGAVDDEIRAEKLSACELIIVALYRQDTINFIKENAKYFSKNCIVLDCTGTKRTVCEELNDFSEEFYFIGAHPMAGREYSGFEYSRDNLFDNASILLTPSPKVPIEILAKIKKICAEMGFTEIVITSADNHDKMIAYTSQLAHVVSNAYVKSPSAQNHTGFSAGSYKDMTRVAKLNVKMWTDLFMDNADNLAQEIKILQQNLEEFRLALEDKDKEKISRLLQVGVECKQNADKN